jgi:hypothetical protein
MFALPMKPAPGHPIITRLSAFLADRETLWFRLPLILLLIAYTIMHFLAAYNLPTPWPDEAHFMWQANGLAEHLTLFAPELNAERTICWMPPGYLILLGVAIKLFGLSLGVARTFSLLTSLTAIVLAVYLARRFVGSAAATLLSLPFVLGSPFIASGNVARMESLLLAIVLASFLCLSQGKFIVGICLLALSPLIHPNGLPFLAAGLVALPFLWDCPIRWRRPTAVAIISIAVVLVAWLGYALYLRTQWSSFALDMNYQYQRKIGRDLTGLVVNPASVSLASGLLVAVIYCAIRRVKAVLLLAVAVPAWWVAVTGTEMWYRVILAVSFLCLSILFYAVIVDIFHVLRPGWRRILGPLLTSGAVLALVAWNVWVAPRTEPLVFPDLRYWDSMIYSSTPYIDDEEIRTITSRLDSLVVGKDMIRIGFYPESDAFFYSGLRNWHVLFNCPVFSTQKADWYVIHLSAKIPMAIDRLTTDGMHSLGFSREDISKYPMVRRDSTDAWFLVPGTP